MRKDFFTTCLRSDVPQRSGSSFAWAYASFNVSLVKTVEAREGEGELKQRREMKKMMNKEAE